MSLTITSVPNNYSTGFTLSGITGSYQIDWGDGNTDANTATHTYVTGGTYTILLYVALTGQILTYSGMTNKTYLTSINAWGDLGGVTTLTTVGGVALVAVPTSLPRSVTNLSSMFSGCSVFNGDISRWNTRNVTSMNRMFFNCLVFNRDISRWNTGKVTNMYLIFEKCPLNQDISHWNTGENTDFNFFLQTTGNFNQNLGSWDIRKYTVSSRNFWQKIQSMSTLNWSLTIMGWASQTPLHVINLSNSNLSLSIYAVAQSAYNTLVAAGWWFDPVPTIIATPVLAISYNESRTRIYTLGSPILSYNPSLLGTYDHVVFTSTPALSTIGLTLDASGVISGSPTVLSSPTIYTVTCSAYDAGNALLTDASFNLTFSVIPANISYSPSSYSFFKNIALSSPITPTIIGGIIIESYSVSPTLPSGLVFDLSDGIISGTPIDASNTAVYTVTATDTNDQLYTTSVSLTVADISYAPVSTYAYLSDVSINVINPTVFSYLYDASFNFSPALPTGLAINTVTGDISGTPVNDVSLNTYNLTVSTFSNYSKTIAFPIKVVDISYTTLNYAFLNNTAVNPIQPKNYTSLQDASLNFAGGLPSGLVMDASGSITGTPSAGSYRATYPLTIRTSNNFTPVYSKDIPFTITVSDISYSNVAYQFLSDVSINISPTSYYDASINFTTPLPTGISMDASGNIRGTPIGDSAKGTYNMVISSADNYTKTIPFTIDVVDISYAQTTYGFFSTVAITPIQPKNYTSLHDASLNFAGGLPGGLVMDASGSITGTPTRAAAPTSYPLTIRTTNQYTPVYSKDIPFTISVIFPLELLRTPMSLTLTSVPANYSTGLNIADISGSYQIDWGDGTVIANTSTHTYLTGGTYTILLYVEKTGRILSFTGMTDTTYFTSINAWGDLGGVTTLILAGSTALVAVPNNLPRTAINLDYMFTGCSVFNGDISRWNTSNVTGMYYMFDGCSAFNGDISRWNTSKVFRMYRIFNNTPFNQDITHWNTGANTEFNLYYGTGALNQNLGRWDIRNFTQVTEQTRNFWYGQYAMDTLNWTLTFMGWGSQTPIYPLNLSTSRLITIYDVAQSAYNNLVAGTTGGGGWYFGTHGVGIPNVTVIPTPVLAVSYNESRTRIYTLNNAILSYIPSLLGTYNYVVFTSTPALSTIGLTLDASGVISGAPTVLSSPTVYNVKCSAYNAGNTLLADASFNLTFSVIQSNVFYSPSSYSFFSNMALSPTITPTITGGVTIVSYSVSPALPSGLAIDPSYGIISGTPTAVSNTTAYTVTATDTNDEVYTPSISLTVADISYAPALTYKFLADVSINVIQPTIFSYLYDASYSFSPALPTGLAINTVTGDISGTPLTVASLNTYNLTVSTFSNYSKTFPFTLSVSDVSYSTLTYEFLANVSINTITNQSTNYDASLNFSPPLPDGLQIDASGTITGTPLINVLFNTFNLIISTESNYSKTIPFFIGVVDISYTETTYAFIGDVLLNSIIPNDFGLFVQDASINFYGGLPDGLTMDQFGIISGTPIIPSHPQTYELTISTSSFFAPVYYSKSIQLTFSVSDISYAQLDYEFLANISFNTITPTLNYDASLNFNPPLPDGMTMDASGTITGIVNTDVPRNSYNLTISTISNYTKIIPFNIGVVDISYAQLDYAFLADVSLNPILPLKYTSLQDASINFLDGLPDGLTIDASGNINGTPINASARSIYPLTISTSTNYTPIYSKQMPFSFGTVDISYTNLVYTFLADISINSILPRNYTDLYDASINFHGGLPYGLGLDGSGNINGTPLNIVQPTVFPLTISTSSNYTPIYNKTVPFTITVDDISYTNLNYGFLNDISVNIQPNPLLTNLYDASLNFSNALPSGLSMDNSGNITGTPNQPTAPTDNTLTLSIPGYSKTIPFNFTVSDISYVNVTYDFFSSVPIRDISAINPIDIYGATLNFAAPAGITIDASGTIRGTPIYSTNQQEFDLTITTISNYQKTIPFFITVANIYYNDIFYEFLSDVQINTIIPNTSNLNNATFSFNPALPNGLVIDLCGNISGTPVNPVAAALYTLSVTTVSDYTKQMPFQLIIADISYATLNYGFLLDVFINEIHPNPLNTLYGSTIEFDALPAGLTYDAIGNISGNPQYAAAPTPYTLTITTPDAYPDIYSKSLIFTVTVSDISYSTLNYGFLSSITINDISSNVSNLIYDASLNFTPPLPAGLILDGSGNISGTPTNAVAPAIYDLTITSSSNSVKTIPFEITVSDVSYVILDFGLIANIALNDITANVPNTLYDASLNFSQALPAGLRLDGSGNILGTPLETVALSEYNLTLTSFSNYTKVLPFHFTVSDISYTTLDYGFLADIAINDISANTPSTLYDASLNFTQPLPVGLTLDGSGTILGTPLATAAPSQYDLTLTSFSNYTKVLPFHITVSDISYATLTYEFLADVLIRDISVNAPNAVYNASLNFSPPLPEGLIIDGSGTVYGTPLGAAAPTEYDLTLTTFSNYTKVLPFYLTVSDLSYTTLTYGFLANQLIRDISATDATTLYGATLNFTPDLPSGLSLDLSGTITGTPIVTVAPANYDLNITISGYHKILPFNFTISDLSYADLTYAFLSDVSINTIQPTVYNVLYDASVNIQPPLPNGLTIDASGTILGTPIGAAPPTTYTLTITTLSNYTRDLPLNLTVSDLSYVGLTYDFLANVPIIEIQSTDQNSVYGATISFTPPLPDGLALDGSGNIRGAANNASDPAIYPLTISVSGYSKAINFALTVSDLSYSALDYIFLAETSILPVIPSIFSNLQTYTLTLDSALQNGLVFDPLTGIFTGTPLVLASEVDYQLTVSSPLNVYQKTMTLAFIVTDISYTELSYNYLENNEFLYTPFELRGFNIAPSVYLQNTFGSLIFTPALPTNLVIDLSYGVITGIPNIAVEANNYILTATTTSGYTKQVNLNIQVEGFSYIINVPRPEYTFNLYDTVTIPLELNVGGYSNFIISPPLPGGLELDLITGTISGKVNLFQANEINLFFITGFRNPSVTVPIIINIINPYARPCAYLCPPPIVVVRQIDTINTRAMRFSTLARVGLGQTRFITNSGTNINGTYQEPPRNKF